MSKITRSMSAMMLGAFILSVGLTACNNDSDKKTTKDSMTVKTTDTMKTMTPMDTMKMKSMPKDTSLKDVPKPIHNP